MKTSPSLRQEVDDDQLIEDTNQLERVALGEGAGNCQVYDDRIPEGSPIAVYAFRPAGASRWRVGHSTYDDDRPPRTENFTLGVRELVIDGRVGLVTDQATQSDWQVLLAPRVRAVSPAATTEVFYVCGLPPQVRRSRLARASGPSPVESRELGAASSEGDDAMAQDAQLRRDRRDMAGGTPHEGTADTVGEGSR